MPDITLSAGLNALVFKVITENPDANETKYWKGCIRLTDAEGNPVKEIQVTLTP